MKALLVIMLAAGVADANVWQRATGDAAQEDATRDFYTAALAKGDDLVQQAESHAGLGAEVEPRRGGQQDQLRDAGLGQLEKRYQMRSVMTARMRIAASGRTKRSGV